MGMASAWTRRGEQEQRNDAGDSRSVAEAPQYAFLNGREPVGRCVGASLSIRPALRECH